MQLNSLSILFVKSKESKMVLQLNQEGSKASNPDVVDLRNLDSDVEEVDLDDALRDFFGTSPENTPESSCGKRKARPPPRWQPEEIKPKNPRERKRLRKSPSSQEKESGYEAGDDREDGKGKRVLLPTKKVASYHYLRHKLSILQRQKYKCCFCASPLCPNYGVQIDHIIPKKKKNADLYGEDKLHMPENLQASCYPCHQMKTHKIDRQIDEFISTKSAFCRTFEDAIDHVKLFMHKKHKEIREDNARKLRWIHHEEKKKERMEKREEVYFSDFSAHSFDEDESHTDVDSD